MEGSSSSALGLISLFCLPMPILCFVSTTVSCSYRHRPVFLSSSSCLLIVIFLSSSLSCLWSCCHLWVFLSSSRWSVVQSVLPHCHLSIIVCTYLSFVLVLDRPPAAAASACALLAHSSSVVPHPGLQPCRLIVIILVSSYCHRLLIVIVVSFYCYHCVFLIVLSSSGLLVVIICLAVCLTALLEICSCRNCTKVYTISSSCRIVILSCCLVIFLTSSYYCYDCLIISSKICITGNGSYLFKTK